jgi:hypothetical protein
VSDQPRKNSSNQNRRRRNGQKQTGIKGGSAAAHRTPAQAVLPGKTEEKPPKRLFSASSSCGQKAPRGVAADEARNLWSPMARVNTLLFRGQIRALDAFFNPLAGGAEWSGRFGAAHAPSPDVRFGHPALRSLDADCAPPSWLRLSATPALGTWAAPHGLHRVHTSPERQRRDSLNWSSVAAQPCTPTHNSPPSAAVGLPPRR